MSKQVDERVVSMQFDNAHFERNVSQSMSTLEKLKQSLKFTGATKGLEDINAAAGNVNMSPLGSAVDTVKVKFSALEVMAVTALTNITNSAVNSAKQLLKSVSVDQVTGGWQKFSDKTTSVATLVAQGNALEDVNDQLDRLNWFTDETSYNFTEMVSNIAKFTATGKDLESSVTAMEGIATWAALSGQNAATASRAMYQLSQAMSAGYMRLEDYKSIQNASMDTEEFRQKVLDAAVSLGTLKKNSNGTYQSLVKGATKTSFTLSQFTTQLTSGMWMTSDVMMDVFNTYAAAVDNIYDAAEEKGMLASEVIDEIYETAEKKSISTDEAIKELGYDFDSFALKAFEAAQKARTFNDAIDSVKDAVSTQWMRTFELIFGDAEKATELWTDLANTLWDVFAGPLDSANEILEETLGKTFTALSEPLETIKDTLNGVKQPVEDIIRTFEDYERVVNEIIQGDWGVTDERWKALTEAGYDWKHVQNLVNAELGVSKYRQTDYVEGQEAITESTEKLTEANGEFVAKLTKMTDAELEALGLNNKQIESIREIKKEADKLGLTVEDFIDNIDEIDGRWVLINSFKNAWAGLVKVFEAIKNAWQEIFPPKSTEEKAQMLYDIIAALHKFSTKLIMSDETAEKLTRTFKGLFAIFKVIKTLAGGALTIAFKVISKILSYFNVSVLDLTAYVGDALVAFEKWFDSLFDVSAILDVIIPFIEKAADAIKEWFASIKNSGALANVANYFKKLANSVTTFWKALKDNDLSTNIIAGLVNGLKDGAVAVWKAGVAMAKALVEKVRSFLGIHSPSTVFIAIGGFIAAGLILGLKYGFSNVLGTVKDLFTPVLEWIKGIDFSAILAAAMAIGTAISVYKISDAIWNFSAPFKKLGDVFESVSELIRKSTKNIQKVIKSFANVLNAVAFDIAADGIKKLAIALLLLVGSIIILTFFDPKELWNAVGLIVALAAILGALAFVMSKINSSALVIDKNAKTLTAKSLAGSLLVIAAAILIMALAVKALGKLDPDQAKQGFLGLAGIVVALGTLIAAFGIFVNGNAALTVGDFGSTMLKMSVAILLMAAVVKILGGMDNRELLRGTLAVAAFSGLMIVLMAAFKLANGADYIDTVGGCLLKISAAIAIMGIVVRLLGGMEAGDLIKGTLAVVALGGLMIALMGATRLVTTGDTLGKVGLTLLAVSGSIAILAGIAILLSNVSWESFAKGAVMIGVFAYMIILLMAATALIGTGENVAKIGLTLLAVSAAIAILAATAFMLSMISWKGFAKGAAMVAALAVIMVGLMAATRLVGTGENVDKVGKTLLMVAGAIAILAGIAVLIGLVPVENLKRGVTVVAIMATLVAGLIAVSKLSKKCVGNIVALTVLIAVLAGAVYLLSTLDSESALISTIALTILLIAVMAVLKQLNKMRIGLKNGLKNVALLTSMAVPLLAFVGVLALMHGNDDAIQNATVLAALMYAMHYLLKQLNKMKIQLKNGLKNIALLTAMAVPMLAFVAVLALAQGMDVSIKNVIAITSVMYAMAGLLKILDLMKIDLKSAPKNIALLTAMAIPLLAFVAVLALAQGMDVSIKNVIAITTVMYAMAGLLKILDLMKVNLKSAPKNIALLTAMAIPMLAFVGTLAVMQGVDVATKNVVALTALMYAMAVLLKILSTMKVGLKSAVKSMSSLTLMAVPMLAFVGILAVMQGIDTSTNNVIALIALMSAATILAEVLSRLPVKLKNVAIGIAALTLMAIPMLAFVGVLACASGIDNAVSTVTALTALATACTLLLIPLGIIGAIVIGTEGIGAAAILIGIAALLAMAVPMLTFVGILAVMSAIPNAAKNAELLTDLMVTIGDLLIKLSLVAPLAAISSAAITSVTSVIVAIGVFATAVGALMDKIPALEKFLDKGLSVLEKVANGIGRMVGAFISGIGERITEGLLKMADDITEFVSKISDAADMASDIKANSFDGIEKLMLVLLEICGTSTLMTITDHLTKLFTGNVFGDSSLETFRKNAVAFFKAMKEIGKAADEVKLNSEAMDAVIEAGTKLAELQKIVEPVGGLVDTIIGTDDLMTFGTTIAGFISSMKIAYSKLDDVSFNTAAMEQIVDAGTKLAELQNILEPIGGLVDTIIGTDDLLTFGYTVASFISSMKEAYSGLDDATFNTAAMEQIVEAGTKLAELQKIVEPVGGLVDTIIGTDDLSTFGFTIASFVSSMLVAYTPLSSFTGGFNTDAMEQIVDAGTKLAELQTLVEPIGGLVDTIIGSDDLSTFGFTIASFVSSMIVAYTPLSSFTGGFNTKAMEQIIDSASKLAELQGVAEPVFGLADVFTGTDDLSTFGFTIASFVSSMIVAYTPLSSFTGGFNTTAMQQIIDAGTELANMQSIVEPIFGLADVFTGTDDLSTFGFTIASFVSSMIVAYTPLSSFTGGFNTTAMQQIIDAGTELANMQSIVEPIFGLADLFTGTDDLATFGYTVAGFVMSMIAAYAPLSAFQGGFNTKAMGDIVYAGTELAKIQNIVGPVFGLADLFTGTDDLSTFGTTIASFISSMIVAYTPLSLIKDGFNTKAMSQIVDAGKSLAELQNTVEPVFGLVDLLTEGTSDLATFGKVIASFISSMKEAYSGLDDVTFNTDAMDAIVTAATNLSKLDQCTSGIDSVIEWFSSKEGLDTFGTKINNFVVSMKEAYSELDGAEFNTAAMGSIVDAALALADLQGNLEPMNKVVSWFKEQDDLGTFGEKVAKFAEAMGKLREGMGENGISEAVVASITNSGNAIIALQKALPEEHLFDGKMNLSEFSDYIVDFAKAMSTFSTEASGINAEAVSSTISTANRVKSLIESLVGLDISGVKAFTGIGTGGIGADGPAYKIAKAMAAYSKEVSGIDTTAVSVSVSAAKTIRTLIAGLAGLDSSGVESFKPETIGSKMKSYAEKVAGIDTTVVSSSISSANRLKNFISSLSGLDTSGVSKFKPESIGTAIQSYGSSVSGVNPQAVSNSISSAIKLRNFINSLASINTSGVTKFKDAVNELSTVDIAGVVKAFSGASAKMSTAGADMITALAKGMLSKRSVVTKAAETIASSASDAVKSKDNVFYNAGKTLATKLASGLDTGKKSSRSAGSELASAAKEGVSGKYNDFYKAGSYLVDGFSSGIGSNTFKAVAKAVAMAQAAITAAKEKLKINSPSKVFKAIGSGIPEGFAMGIGMLGGTVDKSVSNMASSAINSARSTMGTILDALSGDMDAQPTIRPVVDLSEVKTGVNAISGLFDGTQSIGVQSNLSAINVAMNRKLQNGSNDDIISAINKLGSGLDNIRGDTYNIDGITYSNGDEISEAVQSIVQAVKIGRRV